MHIICPAVVRRSVDQHNTGTHSRLSAPPEREEHQQQRGEGPCTLHFIFIQIWRVYLALEQAHCQQGPAEKELLEKCGLSAVSDEPLSRRTHTRCQLPPVVYISLVH